MQSFFVVCFIVCLLQVFVFTKCSHPVEFRRGCGGGHSQSASKKRGMQCRQPVLHLVLVLYILCRFAGGSCGDKATFEGNEWRSIVSVSGEVGGLV